MRIGARIAVLLGLIGPVAMGCASIAGIEDLSLTGSPDGSSDASQPSNDATTDGSSSSSGGSGSGADAKGDTSSPADGGSCSPGQIRCSGNGVQTCGGDGQWSAPQTCVDQTCLAGACVGMCAPGQTHPVPCGNCGTDTQTCTSAGTWQGSGNCSGQGACMPTTTQVCNTYGTQTCTASCAWGACSCPSAPACTPGQAQCSTSGGVEACDACGQLGAPMTCSSGTCMGGVCTGACTPGAKQCSGNGVETCTSMGQWGNPAACTNQTCVGTACTGVCAPGQTNPVSCGNCGTDTQTCDSSGNWQSSGNCAGQGVCSPNATQTCNTYGTETCSPSCAWGACSCTATPVCTPGAKQCSGNGVQTCDSCGQWGSPVACGAGQTCSGAGTCVQSGTDCPGNFLLCDGFESGTIDTTTKWNSPNCGSLTSMGVGNIGHWGSHSLHVAIADVQDTSYVSCLLKTKQSTIFSSTPMYFRAWVYMSGFAGTSNEFFITVQSSANNQSASGGMGINSTGQFETGVANSGGYDFEGIATMAPPMSPTTWTCIEFEVDTDYTTYPNGLFQAWDNTSGTPDPQLGGNAKLQSLLSATFGMDYNGPALPTDFYIDDIAISNAYVPCNQ